ncbi:UNVERIFIED_CONTAM: hypothetical protein Slati_0259000 [Sesamum latifolium]|uniref:Uncharacterized protein n=1 Tax=Sesamum latifolium TaxID=2727402 RepID=A0AAW2YD77_9LAMI
MGRTAKEENSDGIEIISIGKLYTGPWDKKYWSSSRGKDRYPYPVGYKSLRTQNGVTYMMEIQEGPKGPSFTITTDGKSCCGDTPDMAWENLQKKGCSKLWHGKRFSCKIDGVEICVERSSIQLTPDGESLVLLNSTKVPHCREGKLHCSCSACTSDFFEENAVKIVKLSSGYASLVTRLETTQGVCCLLVCEPNFLLAAEEGGKLKLWVMNAGWSGQNEDLYLPTFDCVFPSIVDLKRIPKSRNLVIGHNGYGEFGLWDIDKRHLVSRFSSPDMSVLECVPASIFGWQIKGECKTGVLINEIMDATRTWFSGRNENHVFSPKDKDVAIWLLISTVSDPDSHCYQPCEQEANLDRCWRLALLVNNRVIIGSALDEGAAAVTSDGHGIIGRSDGLVYMWELSTGMKLGNLHSFKGSRVSCITTDTSDSGALAIASGGQLLVYLQPS